MTMSRNVDEKLIKFSDDLNIKHQLEWSNDPGLCILWSGTLEVSSWHGL